FPDGIATACVDCATNADCGDGDACIDNMCMAVCRGWPAVCGSVPAGDGSFIECGVCGGYCSGGQSVCASLTPLPAAKVSFDAFADDADHFYGYEISQPERVLIGDKRSNSVTTLFELPDLPPSSSDKGPNAFDAFATNPTEPGVLYALTDSRTLLRVPIAA